MHHRKHVTWSLPTVVWRHCRHGKHSFLYCCMLDHVYRAEETRHVITTNCCVTSLRTWKTQLPLLCVEPCLQSCCLAMRRSNLLQYYWLIELLFIGRFTSNDLQNVIGNNLAVRYFGHLCVCTWICVHAYLTPFLNFLYYFLTNVWELPILV
jgi:hypothetical protein